jgi:hypothetical protein
LPPVSAVTHHALFGVACAALGYAGLRLARAAGARGLEEIVAAAPLAAAAAVVETLGLGLVGLGTEPLVLAGAAGLTAVAARVVVPAGTRRAERRARLSLPTRAALGALAGIAVVYTAWALRYPALGTDGASYHLMAGVAWIHGGQPGAEFLASYEFPVGNYPLTHEVLLSWTMAISRGFPAAVVLNVGLFVLTGLAGWSGLRALSLAPRYALGAVAAVLLVPVQVQGLNQVNTDVPVLAWLACAAALTASARRAPALAAPALVSAGLALGTKTTGAPLAVFIAAIALVVVRDRLKPLRRPLAAAAVVAAAVSAPWYVRNLIEHGSPTWPFLALPWGDPSPPLIDYLSHSLLERPRQTLSGRWDDYADALGGGVLLLGAPLIAVLLARSRAVLSSSAIALTSLFLFAIAPVTGVGDLAGLEFFPVTALRYIPPALAACSLALALGARDGGPRAARLAGGLLAASIIWSLVRDAALGFPWVPGLGTFLLGAVGGALLAVAIRPLRTTRRRMAPAGSPRLALAAAGAALLGALLAIPAGGFVERHGRMGDASLDVPLAGWFAARPTFADGHEPIAMVRLASALLSGDRLTHRVDFLPFGAPCALIRRRPTLVVAATVRRPVRGRPGELFPPPGPGERCSIRRRPTAVFNVYRIYTREAG